MGYYRFMDSKAMATPIEAFTNDETNMQARVWNATRGGYHVSLCDLDSGETLQTFFHYSNLEDAITKAREVLR